MMNLRSRSAGPILGLVLCFGVATGLVLARRQGLDLPDGVRWAAALSLAGAAIWLTLLYWRRIDEAAREAQKAAWYWGGSLGMGVGFILVTFLSYSDASFRGLLPPDASPTLYVQAGAVGMMLMQLVGFIVAWGLWWWSKR